MYNPIDNLGDYGTIHEDLERYGGDKEKMYEDIRQTGADEAAFRQRAEGGIIGAVVMAAIIGICKCVGKKIKKKRESNAVKQKEVEARFYAAIDREDDNCKKRTEETVIEDEYAVNSEN